MHKPALALMAGLLVGCAATPAPRATEPFAVPETAGAEAAFWHGFGDALLGELVEEALAENRDLRIAASRYEQARALLRDARRDRIPTVTASAEASDRRASADQLPGGARADRDGRSYDAAAVASWEFDLFGRVRHGVAAGRAERDAGAAELAAARIAVVAELAAAYFELRGLQARLQVARDNADNQRASLSLVRARLDAGRGTDFDAARATAQLEGTFARIPALEAAIATTIHRIGVLTGREPGGLRLTLSAPAAPPALPENPPAAISGDLLRRRPDVRAAERRLAAASARVGIATADLYPRFTVSGLIGSQAAAGDDLFERDSETRVIALGIDWSFLDIGRVRARIAAADANAEAHLAQYQQAILLALEESENALVRYTHAQRESAHLADAAAAGAAAARLARLRFDGGAADFLHVLDAERAQLELEDLLVQSRTRSATAMVSLYRSLAGTWEG